MKPRAISIPFLVLALAAVSVVTTAEDRKANVLLQSGNAKATLQGDLKGAITDYKKALKEAGGNHALAARVLIRLGDAYQRLGEQEARSVFERIVNEFSDQKDIAAEARTRLNAFPTASPTSVFAKRGLTQICSEICPYWSITADGRYLLGTAGYVRDLVTGEERSIGDDFRMPPTISADGKQIAFVTLESGGFEIHVSSFNPQERTAERVLLRGEEFGYSSPFGWSPDGKEVFAILARKDQSTVIAAIPISTGVPRVIKSLEWRRPNRASLSPDGRYIAYDVQIARESRDHDILLLAADGSGEAPLVRTTSLESEPTWTPDGKTVVFTSDQNGVLALWKIQVSEGKPQGNPQLIRRLERDIDSLGFERSGSFYYRTSSTRDFDVFTTEIDLESGKVLKAGSRGIETFPGRNSTPAYSPDGQRLAYFSQRSVSGGFWSLVIRSLESSAEKEIPTAFTLPYGLVWFPDGQSVGIAGNTFHRIDVKTGEDLIKERVSLSGAPSLSNDAKSLYYVKVGAGRAATLLMYNLETRLEKELFQGELPQGGNARIAISADGRQIATTLTEKSATELTNPSRTSNTQSSVVSLISVDGGSLRTLRSPSTQQLTVIEWSQDGKNILVQRGNGQLWWVPTDGGEPRQIGTDSFPAVESLHADRKRVAYTVRGAPSSKTDIWVDPDLLKPSSSSSTDGIYFARFDPGTGKVRGPATPLDGKSADSSCAPAFSYDGKSIAFKRRGARSANGAPPLVWIVRSLETGDERILTGNATPCRSAPLWAHDNKSFFDGSTLGANDRIFRFGLSTQQGSPVRIEHDTSAIAVTPDDKTIYLTAPNEKEKKMSIVSVDLASGEQKQVWVSPVAVDPKIYVPMRLAMSPDGRTLALVLSEGGKSQLVRVGVDGSGYRILHSAEGRGAAGSALSRSGLAWTKDGRSILFMDAEKTGQRLLRIAADGGKPEFTGLAIVDIYTDVVFDLSPDGRTLAVHSWDPPAISR